MNHKSSVSTTIIRKKKLKITPEPNVRETATLDCLLQGHSGHIPVLVPDLIQDLWIYGSTS